MSQPITVAVAGLGNRGRQTYAKYMKEHGDRLKVVAVADTDPQRVAEAAATFGLPAERCFDSAQAMARQQGLAQVMVIATPDRLHFDPAMAALERGYHLLLEKPISPSEEECRALALAAREAERHVVVCHVLRYTPFYTKLKALIEAGAVGEVVTIQAIENVGYYHQAHSFVRGNWRSSDETSPMILQKCSHDMDILLWLAGKRLRRVSSFGGLYLFRPDKAPKGAAKRCMGGCAVKAACPYDAEKIYLTDAQSGLLTGHTGWPNSVLVPEPTEASIREALQTGPYGRCVYYCDNNVVDHQVVNLELEEGVTVSLTMSGLTARQYRHTKIMGTLGEIDGDMDTNLIKVTPFGQPTEVIDVAALADDLSGHAGGDSRMLDDLVQLLRGGDGSGTALTAIDHSIESHLACFAAERSRLSGGSGIQV